MEKYLKEYFERLDKLYLDVFGTHPTAPFLKDCSLFISQPDSDGEAEWLPEKINGIKFNQAYISDELIDFYSSYYYLNLAGKYEGILFNFSNNMYTDTLINETIKYGLNMAREVFQGYNCILMGYAEQDGNDHVSIFYNNDTEEVFLYDQDFHNEYNRRYKLGDIISNLMPVI